MYIESLDKAAKAAQLKTSLLKSSWVKYLMASTLAGLYVGLGIILIFTLGAPLAKAGLPTLKLVMGASFGIALTLVIIAGAELFTGNNMIMVMGNIRKTVTLKDTALIWLVSYIGNLIGSIVLAFLFAKSGLANSPEMSDFTHKIVAMKMSAPIIQLFIRGILCNILVCLAVWMCFRVQEDTAKVFVIFWCLFAFISSGFEHSVANMTLLAIPLFNPHPVDIGWMGYIRNLLWVSLGNIVGGSVVIAGIYSFVSVGKTQSKIAG